MNISERKRGDRQRLARMIARESNAMQRDRLRIILLVLQGRQTLQGILDREFGKTFSLNGVYQLLKRHGFVCLEPRPRHPQQNPAAAKAFKRRAPLL